jgi:hypothetical protein
MVKMDLLRPGWPSQLDTIWQWLIDNISPRTLGALVEATEDLGDVEHHWCTGGDGWMYHYVRTAWLPADTDLHLYQEIYGSPSSILSLPDSIYRMAMYLEITDDTLAVMFKLAMRS